MNYRHLADAVDFYKTRGYVYIEDVPWTVQDGAYYATKPSQLLGRDIPDIHIHASQASRLPIQMGHPVASGEQSFLQMMIDGQPIKRAVCVTPCYRHEPRVDTLHRPYFMKVELINAHDVDLGHLIHMVHDACAFFEQFFAVRVVETQDGFDIVEKSTRFELGSYGIRTVDYPGDSARKFRWIYGTGCAEPRLSIAIRQYNGVSGR